MTIYRIKGLPFALTFLGLTAATALAASGPAAAQHDTFAVDQLSAPSAIAVQQLDATQRAVDAGVASRAVPQLDRNAQRPAPPSQLASAKAGRDPKLGQLAAPGAARQPTAQLARPGADPRLSALPRDLVDACDRAAAGKGKPPTGIDCASLVQAAPSRPQISPEEVLLSSALERDGQRLSSERQSLGQTVDAGEVARRLSTGDLRNAPVAQAVAAQAAAEAVARQAVSGSPRTIVPGGGTAAPPGGN